jgi:hypothetical protein
LDTLFIVIAVQLVSLVIDQRRIMIDNGSLIAGVFSNLAQSVSDVVIQGDRFSS